MSFGPPKTWQIIENYSTVIMEGKLLRGFLNTSLLVVVVIPLSIIIASLAAWVFARSKSKFISVLYYICISGILVPPSLITSIWILKILHLYGTRQGLILFYIGIFMSFSIFFITGFIKSIPIQLEESARIDGAGHVRVFFYIIFPLLKPVSATVVIFLLLSIWNDFIYPFFFLTQSSKYTLVLTLNSVFSASLYAINWHLIFTLLVLVNLPLLIFYFFAQRFIVSGIMGGAVKG